MLARSRFLCCPSTQKELTETTNKMLFKINLRSSISLFVVLYGFVLVMFFFVLPIHLKSLMRSFSFIEKQESKIVQGAPVLPSKESVSSRFYEEVFTPLERNKGCIISYGNFDVLATQKHNFYSFDVQTLPLRMKAPDSALHTLLRGVRRTSRNHNRLTLY